MSNTCNTRTRDFKKMDSVIEEYRDVPGGLLPILQQAQDICGCVDEEVQRYISDKTGFSMTTVYGIATFYSQFTLQPRGEHTIGMCMGTACYVRGGDDVFTALQKELKIEPGKTTDDGLFTLEAMRCIGCCGLAPAMMIDGDVFGRLTPSGIPEILNKYRKKG